MEQELNAFKPLANLSASCRVWCIRIFVSEKVHKFKPIVEEICAKALQDFQYYDEESHDKYGKEIA